MRFLSFHNLFRLIKWSFGGRIEPETTNSSGFSSDAFMPEQRDRTQLERAISIACSCLTIVNLIGPPLVAFELAPSWLGVLPLPLVAAPGLLWVAAMWIPRRRAMDRVAIGVGCFTLTPWLVPYTLGMLLPVQGPTLFSADFGIHLLALLATLVAGLLLDVQAEMTTREQERRERGDDAE